MKKYNYLNYKHIDMVTLLSLIGIVCLIFITKKGFDWQQKKRVAKKIVNSNLEIKVVSVENSKPFKKVCGEFVFNNHLFQAYFYPLNAEKFTEGFVVDAVPQFYFPECGLMVLDAN